MFVASTPVKQLLQEAARASDKNVSEFLLDAGIKAAAQTLADRRHFHPGRAPSGRHSRQHWIAPPKSKPRLKQLLQEPGVLG